MKPGVYPDIPNRDYHSGPGVSNSGLALIRKSPAHLRHSVMRDAANDSAEDGQPDAKDHDGTPAQFIGTAFHCLLLEPHEFVREYTQAPRPSDVPGCVIERDTLVAMLEEVNSGRLAKLSSSGSKDELQARLVDAGHPTDNLAGLTGAELKARVSAENERRPGKLPTSGTKQELAALLRDAGRPVVLWDDVKAEWNANNGHRKVLTPEQFDQLHRMRDAVMAHPVASALLTGGPGVAEQSVYWNDPVTGELCRCRPDWWRRDIRVVMDVKTTEDASEEGFAKSMVNYGYWVQHPFYVDGIAEATGETGTRFVFLAVEKSACVVEGESKGVAVWVLPEEVIELGRARYRADLNTYARCKATGKWPGYSTRIQTIGVPGYLFTREASVANA